MIRRLSSLLSQGLPRRRPILQRNPLHCLSSLAFTSREYSNIKCGMTGHRGRAPQSSCLRVVACHSFLEDWVCFQQIACVSIVLFSRHPALCYVD